MYASALEVGWINQMIQVGHSGLFLLIHNRMWPG